jgi:hypothetical protein
MRAVIRSVVVVLVCFVLAAPASARQIIDYTGTTSAPRFHKVLALVIKKDNGNRVMRQWVAQTTLTCEDMSTQRWGVGFGWGVLGENGDFDAEFNDAENGFYLHVAGSIRWGKGSGTLTFNRSTLTADGQDAQLCSSGGLTWTVDRVMPGGSARSRSVPDGVGVLKLRVRQGVAEVVKLIEP